MISSSGMDHIEAKRIFLEIQSRPYAVSTQVGVAANNCFFKGVELLQRLAILGYDVRGRVGETYWDENLIPSDVIRLYSYKHLVTHFFVEINLDGKWIALDPSYDPPLAKSGFPVTQWGDNKICFPITKLYTQQEQIAYLESWNNAEYGKAYFMENADFLKAFNDWIAIKRQ